MVGHSPLRRRERRNPLRSTNSTSSPTKVTGVLLLIGEQSDCCSLGVPVDQERPFARPIASFWQPHGFPRFTPRILTITRFEPKSPFQPNTWTNGQALGD